MADLVARLNRLLANGSSRLMKMKALFTSPKM